MIAGKWREALVLIGALASIRAEAQGGPPLVTDDPGTPGNGHWELNEAVQWMGGAPASIVQAPSLDLNYGAGEHLQLNVYTSLVMANEYGIGAVTGVSLTSLAVKWRFLDEERAGVAVSIYPRVDSHLLASRNREVNAPGSRYFLPVEVSKEFGKFGVNPEIGYAAYTYFPSEWSYGIAVAYELEKDRELLAEVHGRSRVGVGDREFLFNVGARYAFAESWSLIGSAGRTVASYSDSFTAWNLYAGVQIRL